jgi:UDP-glucuronate 4-epimerase
MEYIEALEDALGTKARKEFLPLQSGDIPHTYANVDDLIREFHYKPTMTVKDGVGNFAKWYKEFNK